MTNVLHNLSRMTLGLPSLTGTIIDRIYDEDAALFWPLIRPEPRRRPAFTWSALSPLALPDLPEDIGRQTGRAPSIGSQLLLAAVPPALRIRERSQLLA